MDPKSLAIPLAFIMLAAVLCWQLIGAKGKWWLKLIAIVVVPGFGLAVWGSIGSYKGWPTNDGPPEKAVVIATSVREPDPKTGDPGAIYVWLMPLEPITGGSNPLGYASPGGEPRAYKFPYTRPGHEMAEGAERSIRMGRPVAFERTAPQPANPGGGEEGNEETKDVDAPQGVPPPGTPGGSGRHEPGVEFKMYEFPTPSRPRKDTHD